MRRLVTLSVLVAALMIATSAHAGGSVWEFEGYHRPGDIVESTTAVAWDHPTLGTPEDGPYLIYPEEPAPVPMGEPATPTREFDRAAAVAAVGQASARQLGSVPASEPPAQTTDEPARLDGLWRVVVAVVGLLLVVQMMRLEARWDLHSNTGDISGNESRAAGVRTDETEVL